MTMRDCPDGDLRDLLPLYAAGRLVGSDRTRAESHLAACEACAAELALSRDVARAYAAAPLDTAAIVAGLPVRRGSRLAVPYYRQPLWRIAASLTVMIGAAAMLTFARSKPEATTLSGRNPAVAPTAPGSSAVAPDASPDDDARPVAANRAMGLGVSLSDLTDDQLESLLTALESLDATVLPDPEVMAKPIVPSGTEPDQGRN